MAEAKLYGQSKGMDIKGLIKDYYVYAGENISAGDLVEFINGISGNTEYRTSPVPTYQETSSSYKPADSQAVLMSKNRMLVIWSAPQGKTLKGCVVKVDKNNIVLGTITTISATTYGKGCVSLERLTDNKALITSYYKTSSSTSTLRTWARVVTVGESNIISSGTDTQLWGQECYGDTSLYAISPELVVALGNYNADYCYAFTISINGTTPTSNTTLNLYGDGSNFHSIIQMTNTKFLASFRTADSVCKVSSLTLSDKVFTLNKTLDLASSCTNVSNAIKLTDDLAFLIYNKTGTFLDLTGSDVVTSSTVSLNFASGNNKILNKIDNNNKILVSDSAGNIGVLNINATNKTLTSGTIYSWLMPDFRSIDCFDSELFNSYIVFICACGYYEPLDDYQHKIRLMGINGTVVSDQVLVYPEDEVQVRRVTTGKFDGVAKENGTGGDEYGHNDLIKVSTLNNTLASLPVGTLVRDMNSSFLGKPIIWKIADKNHTGYPDNSVTLITEKCIALRAFDAIEPNNSNSDRKSKGNDKYSVSNIRQWLNSSASAGQWYSAQHSADQSPSSTSYVTCNVYSDDAGFLNGFSNNFKNAIMSTTLTVALNTKTEGGGSETVTDKVFLASCTEVGNSENSIVEGAKLPIFSDNASKIAYCTTEAIEDSDYSSDPYYDTTAWQWWLRTPYTSISYGPRVLTTTGSQSYANANAGHYGVRPLCNLPSSVIISELPDEDGYYRLIFN